ncbi:MAG: hypothetical protein NTU85_03505 [Candidatus Kaiserbacteria bacterium]|nr:hypothetical protein [Candidatus Kaiserbacteria bacterium]
MGIELGSAYGKIEIDASGVKTGVDQAKSSLEGARGSFEAFGKMLGTFGVTLGVTALVRGVKEFTAQSITAFSDLRESVNKSAVVFNGAQTTITAFAKNSARDFGLSQQAAYEAAGTFGNLFTSMGLGQAPAAEMSTGLVRLAADLASFDNIDPAVALEKLRAGMVGEVEPLRTLGIDLSAAKVQAKAMAMGLADASGQVAYASLLEARYALILEQSTNAQGDRARTSGELAGSLRTQEAAMVNLKAAWGQFSAPTYTKMLQALTGDVEALTAVLQKQQYVITGDKATYFQQMIAEATKANSATEPLLQQMGALLTQRQRLLDLPTVSRVIDPTLGDQVDALTAQIRTLEGQILALTNPAEDAERAYTAAMNKMYAATSSLSPAEAQAADYAKALSDALASLRGKEEGVQVAEVAAAILAGKLTEAEAAALGLAGALAKIRAAATDMEGSLMSNMTWLAEFKAEADRYGTKSVVSPISAEDLERVQAARAEFWQERGNPGDKPHIVTQAEVDQIVADGKAASKKIADDFQSKMQQAYEKIKGYASGMVDSARNALKGLLPDMKDQNAPGANGPFENLYRAADVAKLGDKSPWAAKLGLTKESATQIVNDFKAGLITPAVEALIDMPGLIDQVKLAALADQLTTAFVAKVAAAAGVGTSFVDAVTGFGGGEKQAATDVTTNMTTLGTDVVKALAGQKASFETAGGEMIKALIKGIEGQGKALSGAAESLVNAMLAAMAAAVAGGKKPPDTTTPPPPGTTTSSVVPPVPATVLALAPGRQERYASGVAYAAGGLAWVGERGPELVNLPRGSRVYNDRESAGMAGGAAFGAIIGSLTINAPGNDPAAIAGAVGDEVLRAARALGVR